MSPANRVCVCVCVYVCEMLSENKLCRELKHEHQLKLRLGDKCMNMYYPSYCLHQIWPTL